MKFLNEELKRRYEQRRQYAVTNWAGLIVKIALLVLVVYLITHFGTGKSNLIKNYFKNKQTSEQQKEAK
jgi:hypothetical protein